MTSKIFSFLKLHEGSVIPSVRIARFLSGELRIPVTTGEDVADGDLDALIIVNGAYAFCDCLPALGAAIEKTRRLVWVQNDYTIIIPKVDSGAESPFRKAFRNREAAGKSRADFWTTCERESRSTPLSHYVNWNCLTLDATPMVTIAERRRRASDDLFYYGSFRAQRADAFSRYFLNPLVNVTISSPSTKKFAMVYDHDRIAHQPKIGTDVDFYDEIGRHGLGLYLEDRLSHSQFHSPANRFYEMLSAGLPMVFQPECGSSMRRGGYDPAEFQVSNSRSVERIMSRREDIVLQQQDLWLPGARRERAELSGRVQAAWAKQEDRQ